MQGVNVFVSGTRIQVIFCDSGQQCNATIQGRDGANLLIACAKNAAPLLDYGKRVKIKHAADNQCFEIESAVLLYRDNYFVVSMNAPQRIQRRRNTRIACSLKSTYTPLSRTTASLSDAWRSQESEILNISFGGLLLAVSDLILSGSHLAIATHLGEEHPIRLPVEVLRCTLADVAERQSNPALPYRVACRFLPMPRLDQIRLRRYITSYLPISLAA